MEPEQPQQPKEVTIVPAAHRACFTAKCRHKTTTPHKQIERREEGQPNRRLWVCLECGVRTPADG